MELYSLFGGLFSLLCGWILYRWFREYCWGFSAKLPPGSPGFPLLGSTLRWFLSVSSPHPPAFVEYYSQRYGKIFRCNLLGRPTVISADPKFNKFILQNEGKLFRASYPKSFKDLVGRKGLIAIHGELHRKLHSIAASLMTTDKLKSHFITDIQVIISRTMQSWQEREIFCEDECRKLAVSLMANQLLGAYTEEEIDAMAPHCSNFVEGILSFPLNIVGTKYYKAMKARRTLISLICKSIQERSGNPTAASRNGLLTRLMEKENFSEEIVADFLISLLFAGHETTAKTMAFCIYFLTKCPRALEELRVVNETLRLGGIAISVFRETMEEINYHGYVIPKGWMVMPFFSAVHLSSEFYSDPLTFNPWRWQTSETQSRNWRSSELYTPYGSGARLCPGAELARLQISLFLHHFVTRFSWEASKADSPSYFPSARLLARFPIFIKPRHAS